MVFVDTPAGTGFSYAETEEGWISSDTIVANYSVDFIKKVNTKILIILNLVYLNLKSL